MPTPDRWNPEDEPPREVRKAVDARAQRSVLRIEPATIPIFTAGEDGEPELLGSGLLLRVGSSEFIVTAAHVMDRAMHEFWVGSDDRLVGIKGPYSHTAAPKGDRDLDLFDLAIVPLREPEVSELRRCRFLSLDDLAPFEVPDLREVVGSKYLMFGYPCTRHDKRREQVRPLKYISRACPAADYAPIGITPSTHIVLNYDKKRGYTVDGQITLPDPHGISGGGIWKLQGFHGDDFEAEHLVAIAIEWRKGQKVAFGTRVRVLLDGITLRYPHVAKHVRDFILRTQPRRQA